MCIKVQLLLSRIGQVGLLSEAHLVSKCPNGARKYESLDEQFKTSRRYQRVLQSLLIKSIKVPETRQDEDGKQSSRVYHFFSLSADEQGRQRAAVF